MNANLVQFIEDLDISRISDSRQLILQKMIGIIRKQGANQTNINFVCTHNSRRSHLAQIWSTLMVYYYQLDKISCFSSGTEATALFPLIASTLEKQGFKVSSKESDEQNIYTFSFGDNITKSILAFSKRFDHDSIPSEHSIAIMVCSDAEENCPIIPNVTHRMVITYDDPKAFDGTDMQIEMYERRSEQIAQEMKYVFSQI